MDFIEVIKWIGAVIGTLLGLMTLITLGAIAWSQFNKASRNEKKELIDSTDTLADFYKKQAEEYKEMMRIKDEKNSELINQLTEKVGVLTGQLKSEKEQNDRLEKIMQGRNPEMETFMKYMVDSAEKHSETHEAIMKLLTAQGKVLMDLHETSTSNHEILDARKKAAEGTKEVTVAGNLEVTPKN